MKCGAIVPDMPTAVLDDEYVLSQSEVLQHQVGSAPTHRPDDAGAERDEKDEYAEHRGGVSPSSARNSSEA